MDKNKRLIIGVVVLFVVVIGGFLLARGLSDEDTWVCENGQWVRHGNPSSPAPTEVCDGAVAVDYTGKITENYAGSNMGFVVDDNQEVKEVQLSEFTVVYDRDGKVIDAGYIRPGFGVQVKGDERNNIISAREIRIIDEVNVVVYEPKVGETIGLPVVIKGEARVFENTFNYRIKDGTGKILWESFGMTEAPDAGIFGAFTVQANYTKPGTSEGTIEVFEYSPKDGEEVNKVVVPVRFGAVEDMMVKIFLSNRKSDPNFLDCSKVYAVERRVAKTTGVARAALEELLGSVGRNESELGYFSNIPSGVQIKSLTIENGVAKVDFSKELEPGGGSCLVTAIRAQIEQTLKQFPTVTVVEISINGNKDEILQP